MAATSTLVAAAAIITLVALTTRAEAQSLSPYYGPDGRVYYRRADPAIPQQPYAAGAGTDNNCTGSARAKGQGQA